MTPWIKIEVTTPDKPEVVLMSTLLGIDPDAVVGKLFRLWAWADLNSSTGNNITVTSMFLDRLTYQSGFAEALRKVGWLDGEDGNLTFTGFHRHNGSSAKARAETALRVAKHRNNKPVTDETEKVLPKPLPEIELDSTTTTTTTTRAPAPEAAPSLNRGCTLQEAQAYALAYNSGAGLSAGRIIPADVVTLWHDERLRLNWVTVKGLVEIPIADWQADLRAFAHRYAVNEQQPRHSTGGRSQKPQVPLTTAAKAGW